MKRARLASVVGVGVVVGVVAGAASGCQQRDPLFCAAHPGDPRCGGGDGGIDGQAGVAAIGGSVIGKQGGGLILLDNGRDDKLITTDGPFQFATGVPIGTPYEVEVGAQPSNPSQRCVVGSGAGIAANDVTAVTVTCTTATYAVGGTVVGFTSGALTLQDNGGDDLPFAMNGAFTFPTKVASGTSYAVGIKPGTGGSCNVSGGFGTVGASDISTVVVNCTPNTFTIGGTVTGLNGTVKLHNGNDTISVAANGSFAFPTPVLNNQAFEVSIAQQPGYPPAAQTCVVTNGTGNVNGGNVITVGVACTTNRYTVGGAVSGLTGTLVLRDNGGDDLVVTANGAFTFATPVYSGLTYAVTAYQKPANLTCTVTRGSGTVTNANVTTVAVTCGDRNIKCGAGYCQAGAEKCCDPEGFAICEGTNALCLRPALRCADAAECDPGQVCCARVRDPGGVVEAAACRATCTSEIQMCAPGTTECQTGTCQAWSALPGYDACR